MNRGILSSARQIARLCEVDVAFRVICAQDAPVKRPRFDAASF